MWEGNTCIIGRCQFFNFFLFLNDFINLANTKIYSSTLGEIMSYHNVKTKKFKNVKNRFYLINK